MWFLYQIFLFVSCSHSLQHVRPSTSNALTTQGTGRRGPVADLHQNAPTLVLGNQSVMLFPAGTHLRKASHCGCSYIEEQYRGGWVTKTVWTKAGEPMACGIHCCPKFLFLLPDHRLYIVKNVCVCVCVCVHIYIYIYIYTLYI